MKDLYIQYWTNKLTDTVPYNERCLCKENAYIDDMNMYIRDRSYRVAEWMKAYPNGMVTFVLK